MRLMSKIVAVVVLFSFSRTALFKLVGVSVLEYLCVRTELSFRLTISLCQSTKGLGRFCGGDIPKKDLALEGRIPGIA